MKMIEKGKTSQYQHMIVTVLVACDYYLQHYKLRYPLTVDIFANVTNYTIIYINLKQTKLNINKQLSLLTLYLADIQSFYSYSCSK